MKLIEINSSQKILYDMNILSFAQNNNINSSIIYFSNNYNSDINSLNNIIYISEFQNDFNGISFKHIKPKITKYLSNNFVIAINIDNNVSFRYMKYLINNLIYLFKILKKHKIIYKYEYKNLDIACILSCDDNAPYFNDICTAFKALTSHSKREQYETIYDYACSYLDYEFTSKNICGFCNNTCDAYRAGLSRYELNGCCYTINYGPGGIIIGHNPCIYLVNNQCYAKCISCKLHTCFYLRAKNIRFKITQILLLNCFFSYKQYLILKYNVFKTRDEIIDKLLANNYVPFIIYYMLSLYKIT